MLRKKTHYWDKHLENECTLGVANVFQRGFFFNSTIIYSTKKLYNFSSALTGRTLIILDTSVLAQNNKRFNLKLARNIFMWS